jgi:hypothetical protein
LRVVIDGVALAEAEARAFWDRFSVYMEEHPRDLAGFAKSEGLTSVEPQMGGGGATLACSRTAAQTPYANARASSGSSDPRKAGGGAGRGAKSSKKSR